METTLFGDAIISQTDLKTNQKRWFDRALKSPVSITGPKGRSFVLINREQVQSTYSINNYAVKILQYIKEIQQIKDESVSTIDAFPWAIHLNDSERKELLSELVLAFNEALHSDNWKFLEETIDSWKATAEALMNSKFIKIISSPEESKEYTTID
jgi:hypothetical protein